MKITISEFVEGARSAVGCAVIIDVFRAMSVACDALAAGAKEVLAVGDLDQAFLLKSRFPDACLIAERSAKKVAGADFGNSPTELAAADLRDRTVIHSTHAGTQGLVNARSAGLLLCGAFVNARATADFILAQQPDQVSLVCMGYEATSSADEDLECARYLRTLLSREAGEPIERITARLRISPSSSRFFDPEKPWCPESDFDRCLELDRFPFAVIAQPAGSQIACLRKVVERASE